MLSIYLPPYRQLIISYLVIQSVRALEQRERGRRRVTRVLQQDVLHARNQVLERPRTKCRGEYYSRSSRAAPVIDIPSFLTAGLDVRYGERDHQRARAREVRVSIHWYLTGTLLAS